MMSSRRRLRLLDPAKVRRAIGSGCQIVSHHWLACSPDREPFVSWRPRADDHHDYRHDDRTRYRGLN